MAPNSEYRNFSSAVAKINREINEEIKLENNAKEFFGLHLCFLAESVAEKAAQRCTEAGKQRLDQTDVASVVANFFSNDVLRYAHSEGVRNVMLHSTGLKVFIPKIQASRSASGPTRDRVIPAVFQKAVTAVKKRQLQMTKVPKFDEGLQKVNVTIANVANRFLKDLCEYVSENKFLEIDHTHVKESLKKNLKGILAEHANCQGDKQVDKYEKGELIYDKTSDTPETGSRHPPKITRKKVSKGKPTKKSVKSVQRVKDLKKKKTEKRRKSKRPAARKGQKRKMPPTKKTRPMKRAKRMKPKKRPSSRKSGKKIAPKRSATMPRRVQGIPDFSQGIIKLLDMNQRHADQSGIEKLNSSLMAVCGQFLEECDSPKKSAWTIGKVRGAAERSFPPKLLRHVLANAARTLLFSTTGMSGCEEEDT